ncbi:MAG: hypothetical protein K0S31_4276 [Sphingobacterium multivorum]|jgi:hypothetical protein|nr:hypothetical protein [Sphingobacterium multivorum]
MKFYSKYKISTLPIANYCNSCYLEEMKIESFYRSSR